MKEKQAIISVRSAKKIYRMGEVDVPALRDVSLEIYDGEFLVILGPSGSGKSTLLNLVGGMDKPTSGTLDFLGKDLSNASEKELTLFRRNEIGFVFQFYNLVPTLTALENIQVATEVVPDAEDPMESLSLVGLQDRADHFPSQLSGGEQQRVSIARALASNPRLLLCDEPTGALDLETGTQVLGLLSDLNSNLGRTIVLITHNTVISGLGNRVVSLQDGSVKSIKTNNPPKSVEEIEW